MVLAVDFLIVVDEWRSNPLNFARIKVRVQERFLRSLERKDAPQQWRQKLIFAPRSELFTASVRVAK